MTENLRQKFKCHENEKSFKDEIKIWKWWKFEDENFYSFLKGFWFPKINVDLRVRL